MPKPPKPAILLAHAVGLIGRARGMLHHVTDPAMRSELERVDLAIRDVRAWLQPPPTDTGELVKVDAALTSHAKRLDDIDNTLRARADAKH